MTRTRRKHFGQLGALYAIVFATGFLWRWAHSTGWWIAIIVVFFGVAPWLVLSQPDQPDAWANVHVVGARHDRADRAQGHAP